MLYELHRFVKRYGNRTILDIDSLAFAEHCIYGLIGPNGAGKTTLLKHLAFLEEASSGTLVFRGRQITSERSASAGLRRRVVLVDQNPIMFSGTVAQNVAFGLKIRGVGAGERHKRVSDALEQVGMSGFGAVDAGGLSGGEVKRVALARALVLEPEVLLCDEPTANVDREHQEIIMNILEEANRVRRTSIILSTHHLSQSRRLAHHLVLLQYGKVAKWGEENTFRGEIVRDADGRHYVLLSGGLRLELRDAADLHTPGKRRLVHIDPRAIGLRPSESAATARPGQIGTVTSVARENGYARIVVDIGVPLHVVMPLSGYRDDPLHICQAVHVVIPGPAIKAADGT